MTLLLLTLLFQDRPIESSIEAFLKGDDAARVELLKLGAFAIRPVQKARDKAPEKIDALVFELKKAAAYPVPTRFDADFGGSRSVGGAPPLGPQLMNALGRGGIPFFVDRIDPTRMKSQTVAFESKKSSVEVAEEICRQTGLDFGYFHNAIVFGHSDRLWPSGPPVKPRSLTAEEAVRVKALIEKLGDETIETRETATRELLALGPPVIAVLEANLKRKEGELAARCAALIEKLTPNPRGAFGPPGAVRQKRTDAEEKALKHLQSIKVSLAFDKASVADVAGYAGAFAGLPIEVQGDVGKAPVSVQANDWKLIDFLCLVTQSRDLDFMIRDQKVIVDTREAIDKALPRAK